ncbi:hypothetical protein EJ02DRAFT_454619, partial [Clathrospora elynae]
MPRRRQEQTRARSSAWAHLLDALQQAATWSRRLCSIIDGLYALRDVYRLSNQCLPSQSQRLSLQALVALEEKHRAGNGWAITTTIQDHERQL